MKCSVCGSEIKQGEGFCGNCGVRVSESASTFGSANNNQTNNEYEYQNVGTMSVKPQNTTKRNAISIVVIILIVLVCGGGWYYYNNYMTKTVSGTGYTIELPVTLKENPVPSEDIADSFMNSDVLVNVEILKYSELGGTEDIKGMSVMEMYTLLKLYGSSDISFDDCDGDYIYYSQSAYGKKWYGLCSMKENDEGYYFFEFGCDDSESEAYIAKFKKWSETVKFV